MASFFSSVRQGFGRNTKSPGPGRNGQQPSPTGSGSPLSTGVSPVPHSPGLNNASPYEQHDANADQSTQSRKPPYFFREEYSNLIVKGNFMTLAAKPAYVDEGEWLAHQVVEQYRLLDAMIRIIKTHNDKTGQPICNPSSCPTMSAAGHTYTWLDQQKRPIKIPACQYILLVQKWIEGKFDDRNLFPIEYTSATTSPSTPGAGAPIPAGPTNLNLPLSVLAGKEWLGKSSGFPENFETDVKSIYRQMMRCYAHIYHGHWLEPFWDLNATPYLNTCFIHFVNVGRTFGVLGDRELEPMFPLIQIWDAKGLLPGGQARQPAPQPQTATSEAERAQPSNPAATQAPTAAGTAA